MAEKIIELKGIKCIHGKYIVTHGSYYVECGICGEKLNPFYVIEDLARSESKLRWEFEKLDERVEKTKDKMRCKCQHCGKMTKIER